ncbi:MAG: ATP-binding protein [Pseudomonadota bacterium]
MSELTVSAPCEATEMESGSSARTSMLLSEVAWAKAALDVRLNDYFGRADDGSPSHLPGAPELVDDGSAYAQLLRHHSLSDAQRLILMLALLPHLQPQALDLLFVRNKNLDRGFSEFGGSRGRSHGGFLPTGETAVFLLAGTNLTARLNAIGLLDGRSALVRGHLLRAPQSTGAEPPLAAPLEPTADCVHWITTGSRQLPDYSVDFPAQRVTTSLTWSDLVLSPEVQNEVDTLRAWLHHGDELLTEWGLARTLKPGYRALFYGPPGTGKTLTATLLGRACEREVYRIDLANVVSKYIGETEKNLANVFDQASDKRWILFFDEADALFGKRTDTSSAHDRYANQEVAYLLQRIEDYPGVAILASNLKANIDEAFTRRFQSVVYFALPDAEQRLALWQRILGKDYRLAPDVDLSLLAERYELAGGAIANVARHAALSALQAEQKAVRQCDLQGGVAREMRKEGKAMQARS